MRSGTPTGRDRKGVPKAYSNEDTHQLLSEGVQFPKAMADDVLVGKGITGFSENVKTGIDVDKSREAGRVPPSIIWEGMREKEHSRLMHPNSQKEPYVDTNRLCRKPKIWLL